MPNLCRTDSLRSFIAHFTVKKVDYYGPRKEIWFTQSVITLKFVLIVQCLTGVDPGFPVGECGPIWGHGPLMRALFSKNVCENERIGSRGGGGACAGKFCM